VDLVILLWDGLSEGTRHLLEWLRQQRKDHLVAYIEFAVRQRGSQEITRLCSQQQHRIAKTEKAVALADGLLVRALDQGLAGEGADKQEQG